jgi:glycosyltransferase involved in cell wall biosynthesis
MKIPRFLKLHKLQAVPNRLDTVERQVLALHESLDALKSSLELSPELIAEFEAWKARHPPADGRPLVSVCIATYNRSELLMTRSMPSVLGQTYGDFELIVVGDGCTDDTAEAIAAVTDERVQFVNLPRTGPYPADPLRRWMVAGTAAMNKALSLTRGDFVTHLDDDDEYLPTRLEELVDFAVREKSDLVWHPFWYQPPETDAWQLNEAPAFTSRNVTTSSVLYRSWLARIEWDPASHLLREPGDWNRFRRMKYLDLASARYPRPLLRHYRERSQQ